MKQKRRNLSKVLTFSIKASLFVNFLTAHRESCTIPITGLFDCGVTIIRGTINNSDTSARVSIDCGTCMFISSPSKSALYGVVTLQYDVNKVIKFDQICDISSVITENQITCR